ncbi:MAG: hypothetical protein AAF683_01385 [Pseudomonadota bacterium]
MALHQTFNAEPKESEFRATAELLVGTASLDPVVSPDVSQDVRKVNVQAREERRDVHAKELAAENYEQDGDSVNGMMKTMPNKDDKKASARLRRQQRTQFYLEQLQALEQQMAALNDKIERLNEHIARSTAVRDDLATGKMDLQEALKKEATQRAIREWEKRTGKKFDPSDPNEEAVLLDILQSQIEQDRHDVNTAKDELDRLERRAHEINEAALSEGVTPQLVQQVRDEADTAFDADVLGYELDDMDHELAEAARDKHDGIRNEVLASDERAAGSASALDIMLGSGPLADASEALSRQFPAAAGPAEEADTAPNAVAFADLGLGKSGPA